MQNTSCLNQHHSNLHKPNSINQQIIPVQQYELQLWNHQIQQFFNTQQGLDPLLIKKLKKMKVGVSLKDCSICVASLQKNEVIYKLPCQHIFHRDCLKKWLKVSRVCPICRFNLQGGNLNS